MRMRWPWYGLKYVVFAAVAVAAIGAVVMLLWNALMPTLFGVPAIGFLQAIGLLLLSKILLGGVGGDRARMGHRRHWRARMERRWEQMTDEEREQFRAGLRRRCGRSEPAAESKR